MDIEATVAGEGEDARWNEQAERHSYDQVIGERRCPASEGIECVGWKRKRAGSKADRDYIVSVSWLLPLVPALST